MLASRSLAAAFALLSLLGCWRRTEQLLPDRPAPERPAPGGMRRPEPTPTTPATADDETTPHDEKPTPPRDPLDDAPRPQRYELKSPDGLLRITVEQSSDTGTMHFADRVRIQQGEQVIERSSHVTKHGGTMAPLIDRIVPLPENRYLLLGWASSGAGQQQDHALLIQV